MLYILQKDNKKAENTLDRSSLTFITDALKLAQSLNFITTVGYLLEAFIRLWIPSMVRIFTSAWS